MFIIFISHQNLKVFFESFLKFLIFSNVTPIIFCMYILSVYLAHLILCYNYVKFSSRPSEKQSTLIDRATATKELKNGMKRHL